MIKKAPFPVALER